MARITKKNKNKKIRLWILFSVLYAFLYALLSGTMYRYYNSIEIGFLVLDVPIFLTMLGISTWILISYFLFQTKLV